MSKVYIVNNSGNEYDKAKEFGDELIFLTTGFVKLSNIAALRTKIKNLLKESSADDFLILEGSKLLCALTVLVWKELNGKCLVLQWNPSNGTNRYEAYEL